MGLKLTLLVEHTFIPPHLNSNMALVLSKTVDQLACAIRVMEAQNQESQKAQEFYRSQIAHAQSQLAVTMGDMSRLSAQQTEERANFIADLAKTQEEKRQLVADAAKTQEEKRQVEADHAKFKENHTDVLEWEVILKKHPKTKFFLNKKIIDLKDVPPDGYQFGCTSKIKEERPLHKKRFVGPRLPTAEEKRLQQAAERAERAVETWKRIDQEAERAVEEQRLQQAAAEREVEEMWKGETEEMWKRIDQAAEREVEEKRRRVEKIPRSSLPQPPIQVAPYRSNIHKRKQSEDDDSSSE